MLKDSLNRTFIKLSIYNHAIKICMITYGHYNDEEYFGCKYRNLIFDDENIIDDIYNKYEKKGENEYDLEISPGLVLYEIIQAMLEKMFQVSSNIRKDIRTIEKEVFRKSSSPLVKDILIKKRNIIVLKHMFQPQM